jgi:hypothetical protein
MQDARYFRTQAEFCMKLANQLSDVRAAETLRASAANHFARAVELEAPEASSGSGKAAPE